MWQRGLGGMMLGEDAKGHEFNSRSVLNADCANGNGTLHPILFCVFYTWLKYV